MTAEHMGTEGKDSTSVRGGKKERRQQRRRGKRKEKPGKEKRKEKKSVSLPSTVAASCIVHDTYLTYLTPAADSQQHRQSKVGMYPYRVSLSAVFEGTFSH